MYAIKLKMKKIVQNRSLYHLEDYALETSLQAISSLLHSSTFNSEGKCKSTEDEI